MTNQPAAPTPPGPDVRGFLSDAEGHLLFEMALEGGALGPILEIGSWCGRSTVWLGQGAGLAGTVVFALDHHRGSEEHQAGEMFHDPELVDAEGRVDTLREFRRNIARAGLEAAVIPIVASTAQVAPFLKLPLGMVFIDGGHSLEAALMDWRSFGQQVMPGGLLAIHDVFPDAGDGGQAPFTVWRLAVDSGLYRERAVCESLRVLERLG